MTHNAVFYVYKSERCILKELDRCKPASNEIKTLRSTEIRTYISKEITGLRFIEIINAKSLVISPRRVFIKVIVLRVYSRQVCYGFLLYLGLLTYDCWQYNSSFVYVYCIEQCVKIHICMPGMVC